ncbi:MAG TPA: DUF4145 domain-containing protein [Nocardioidaceae bacterium]|nr:DUF4145 domain-containing protein [Nocardioidaceae bacterium]
MLSDPHLIALGKAVENDAWPRPKCPGCMDARINFEKPTEILDPGSASSQDHPAWEPDWIYGSFHIVGRCEGADCGQIVLGVGSFRVGQAEREYEQQYATWYSLDYLSPPIILLRVPESAPTIVSDGIERASRLLLADPGLAATALRTTVELFLTSEGVAAQDANGNFISAHKRIGQWEAAGGDPKVAALFKAVKWIGNVGTHEDSDLTLKDVLEGAEFLDEAFHRLFVGPDIDLRAQAINSAKGPNRATPGPSASPPQPAP